MKNYLKKLISKKKQRDKCPQKQQILLQPFKEKLFKNFNLKKKKKKNKSKVQNVKNVHRNNKFLYNLLKENYLKMLISKEKNFCVKKIAN